MATIQEFISELSAPGRAELAARSAQIRTERNAQFAAAKAPAAAVTPPVLEPAVPVVETVAPVVAADAVVTPPVAAPAVVVDAQAVVVPPADTPALEGKGKPFMKAAPAMTNSEQGVIMLVGSLADAIDLDNDIVPAEILIKCAHEFTGRADRKFNANHDETMKATLVESATGVPILKSGRRLLAGEHIPENDPMVSLGLVKAAGEATCWIAGVKPEDPAVVAAAKAGAIAGASWGAFATRSAVA